VFKHPKYKKPNLVFFEIPFEGIISKLKTPSRRNVQRFDNNFFVFKEAEKRYNMDFRTRKIVLPKYVDLCDLGRMNIVICFENIDWKDVVSINASFDENAIRIFMPI
jgi:hypothetical protein